MSSERIVSLTRELGIPDAADINEVIRRSVLALSEGQGIRKDDIAMILGIGRTTAFGKLTSKNPAPFTAAEIGQLAAFFEVPVADFFDGLGGRIRLAQKRGDRIVRLPVGAPSGDEAGATRYELEVWTLFGPGVKSPAVKAGAPSSGSFRVA